MTLPKRKRLFFDIETSPNIGLFWEPGPQISIQPAAIVRERSIICVGAKWEGDKEVQCWGWDSQQRDDKVVKRISQMINEADEIVSHNGDRFDLPWVRGRCLKLGYPMSPQVVSYDTCALSRRLFKLNSNQLEYIGKYLGLGGKAPSGYQLWVDTTVHNDRKALARMMDYCKRDVDLLEKVWSRIKPFVHAKGHVTGQLGECPECASKHLTVSKRRSTAAGHKQVQLRCNDCGKYQTIAASRYAKLIRC